MTPMGLHNLSDVQQYRKLVEMRNQDIIQKREDALLRQYQHVTQGLTDDASRNRILTTAGTARETPLAGATPLERQIHAAVKRHGKRGKRELAVAGAAVGDKPYIPRRGGASGSMTGSETVGGLTWDPRSYGIGVNVGIGKGKGKGP